MPPIATPRLNAGDLKPKLNLDAGVFVGTRWFDIYDASSIEDCYNATGLPLTGQVWSVLFPRVKARSYRPDLQPGPSGVYIMRVDYREDSLTEYTAEPELVITTTLVQNSTSMMVDSEYRDRPDPKKLTNDKRGVPRMLTTVSFNVLQFFAEMPSIDPFMTLSDEPKLNSDPVVLKNFMNSGSNITIPAERLVYRLWTPGNEQGLFTITHHLEMRRDWKNYRPIEDTNGDQIKDPQTGKGQFEAADMYEPAVFGGVLG